MAKYVITWVEETVYGLTVEAENSKAALDIFEQSKYDWEDVQVLDSLGVQEDSVGVEQV